MRAWLTVAALLAMSLALPSPSAAHGRQPNLVTIALDPSDDDHLVLTSTHGLIVSHDAGASWTWECSAAFGADPLTEYPDGVVTSDGSTVLATFDGVVLPHPDLCDDDYPDDALVRNVFIVDVAPDPIDPQAVWALASSGVDPDRIARSDDAGRTWSAVGDPIEDVLVERIAVAPSDPTRVYVSGSIPPSADGARQAFLLRSDDGGQTFARVEIPLLEGERLPHVMAVDPTNPDRLFVRMVHGNVDPRPERMLVSEDGGQTFASVLELPQMLGLAMSDDGQTVWIGSGLNGGLWKAEGGANSFEQVNDVDVRCLAARGDTLFVCADQLTAEYALGRSSDGGATIEPIMRFQDALLLPRCDGCSAVATECSFWQRDFRSDLEIFFAGQDGIGAPLPDAGASEPCVRDGGVLDGSADGGSAPPTGGCGCASVPGRPAPLAALAMIAGALVLRRRRA